jgi:hypothetical protein
MLKLISCDFCTKQSTTLFFIELYLHQWVNYTIVKLQVGFFLRIQLMNSHQTRLEIALSDNFKICELNPGTDSHERLSVFKVKSFIYLLYRTYRVNLL